MNYEKKYLDALAKAREIHRNEDEKRFDMEWLFPELAESEDEKMSRDLIAYFKNNSVYTKWSGLDVKKVIEWLEKQGQTFTKKDVDDAYLKGICDAKQEFEKQGEQILANSAQNCKDEQKPAWSEEDENFKNYILINCMHYAEKCGHVEELHNDEIHKQAKAWLKSLRPQNRWKPSEEQMKTLEYYMHTLTCNEHKEVLFGLMEQLKELKEE